MPFAASSNSHSFSCTAWGAWSVAMASIVPSRRPSRQAAASSRRRRGGYIFALRVVGQQRLVAVAEHDGLVVEREVVRRHLRSYVQALRPGAAHQLDAAGGAEVGDVHVRAGLAGKGDVAGNHVLLGGARDALEAEAGRDPAFVHDAAGELRVLAMVDDRQVEGGGVLEGVAHDAGVRDGVAVVAEADAACVRQLAHLRELLTGAALRHCADRQHAHEAGLPRSLHDVVDGAAIVHRRLGVGHGADGSEAAARRRPSAGLDGLLVLEAGIAQVRVEVDEPRRNDEAGGVDDPGAVGRHAPGRPTTMRPSSTSTSPRPGRCRSLGRGYDRRVISSLSVTSGHLA